jgi:hypothetical protein
VINKAIAIKNYSVDLLGEGFLSDELPDQSRALKLLFTREVIADFWALNRDRHESFTGSVIDHLSINVLA